ncbi:MAG: hypothetical protein ABIG68_00070 [Acidobacteriota bacterium]
MFAPEPGRELPQGPTGQGILGKAAATVNGNPDPRRRRTGGKVLTAREIEAVRATAFSPCSPAGLRGWQEISPTSLGWPPWRGGGRRWGSGGTGGSGGLIRIQTRRGRQMDAPFPEPEQCEIGWGGRGGARAGPFTPAVGPVADPY